MKTTSSKAARKPKGRGSTLANALTGMHLHFSMLQRTRAGNHKANLTSLLRGVVLGRNTKLLFSDSD
jgi:hypothetical protein